MSQAALPTEAVPTLTAPAVDRTPVSEAMLGRMVDMRLRLVQAKHLTSMMMLRPDLAKDLLPLLAEAVEAPPTYSDGQSRQHRPPSETARKVQRMAAVKAPAAIDRRKQASDPDSITPAQRRVLEQLAAGHTKVEIGQALHLSAHTVKTHCNSIFAQLQVNTAAAAVATAIRTGLIE